MMLHPLKIGRNSVQNPITYNFLAHIYCLFVYDQGIKAVHGYDKGQTSKDTPHLKTEAHSLGFESKSERGDNTLQFLFLTRLLECSRSSAKPHYFCCP